MLSSTTLKTKLDEKKYSEALNYCNQCLEQVSGTSLLTASAKITNQLAFHLFNNSCGALIVNQLVSTFGDCLSKLVSQPEDVDAALANKILTSCYHVFAGRLVPDINLEGAWILLPVMQSFMITFKKYLDSSDVQERLFSCCLQVIKGYKVQDVEHVRQVYDCLNSTFRAYMAVTSVEKKNSTTFPSVVREVALLLRYFPRFSSSIFPTQRMLEILNGIFEIFQECYENGQISKRALTHNLTFELYGLDLVTSLFSDRATADENSCRDCMRRFQRRLQDGQGASDAVEWTGLMDNYRDKYASFLRSLCHVQKTVYSNLESALFSIDECQRQVDWLLANNPNDFRRYRVETVYVQKLEVLVDMERFEEAAECAAKLILLTVSAGFDPFNAGQLFVNVKKKHHDKVGREAAVFSIFGLLETMPSKEDRLALAVVVIVASRRYPEFHAVSSALTNQYLTSAFTQNPFFLAVGKLERVWTTLFKDAIAPDVFDDLTSTCHEVIDILSDCETIDAFKAKIYSSLAKFLLFLTTWNERRQKLVGLLNEKDEKLVDDDPDAATDDKEINLRPFGNVVSLEDDEKLLAILVEVLELIVQVYSSSHFAFHDIYINQMTILPMLAVVAEVLKTAGDNNRHRNCLLALVSVAKKSNNKEAEVAALSEIVKLSNSSSLSVAFHGEFSEAMARLSRNNKYRLHNLKGLLASACFMHRNGDVMEAMNVVKSLYSSQELPRGSVQSFTFQAECCLLLAKCRCNPIAGSRLSTDLAESCYKLLESKLKEVDYGGPIELGSNAVKFAAQCRRSFFFGPNCSLTIDRMAEYFQNLNVSYESRRFMSDMYSWTGLPLEQMLMTKMTLAAAVESGFLTRIAESLLTAAEAALTVDEGSNCKIQLSEVEDILRDNICSKEDALQKPKGNPGRSNVLVAGEDAACASPILQRPLYGLPKWLNHQVGCECVTCSAKSAVHLLLGFVLRFFTYHAVTYEMEKDEEAADWMFGKAAVLRGNITKKAYPLLKECDSENYLQLLLTCFMTQRWHVEVLGRRSQLPTCAKLLKEQKLIIQRLPATYIQNFPFYSAVHWELVVSVRNLLKSRREEGVADEPELCQRMSNLLNVPDLNSSDYKTPAVCRTRRPGAGMAPVRKMLPVAGDAYLEALPTYKLAEAEDRDADVEESDSPPKSEAKSPTEKASARKAPSSKMRAKRAAKPAAKKSSDSSTDTGKRNGGVETRPLSSNAENTSTKQPRKRGNHNRVTVHEDDDQNAPPVVQTASTKRQGRSRTERT